MNVRSMGWCSVLVEATSLAALAACADARGDLDDARYGITREPIIGGFLAEEEAYDATGALVAVRPSDQLAFCTATLIAPEVIVTAKHCAKLFAELEQSGYVIEWRSGPDALAPTSQARVVATQSAPGDVGGYVGEGRDVAVALLGHPVAIEPVELAPLDESWLGRSLITLGYGVFSPSGASDARRRVGHETVLALSGRVNEALFGDFESFVEWVMTRQSTDIDIVPLVPAEELEPLSVQYDTALLFDGHEAVGGGAAGDLLTCRGDSGGPLLGVGADGRFVSHGVISGGPDSLRSECEFGSVYSTFGPVTLPFLLGTLSWADPCGELEDAGRCDGGVVERCVTNLGANLRRIEREDCAARGLICTEGDVAGCAGQ